MNVPTKFMENNVAAYKARLPIALKKYQDLEKLCKSNVIPPNFHAEYAEMPTDSNAVDALNETDEDDSNA